MICLFVAYLNDDFSSPGYVKFKGGVISSQGIVKDVVTVCRYCPWICHRLWKQFIVCCYFIVCGFWATKFQCFSYAL